MCAYLFQCKYNKNIFVYSESPISRTLEKPGSCGSNKLFVILNSGLLSYSLELKKL